LILKLQVGTIGSEDHQNKENHHLCRYIL